MGTRGELLADLFFAIVGRERWERLMSSTCVIDNRKSNIPVSLDLSYRPSERFFLYHI